MFGIKANLVNLLNSVLLSCHFFYKMSSTFSSCKCKNLMQKIKQKTTVQKTEWRIFLFKLCEKVIPVLHFEGFSWFARQQK